MNVLMVSDLVFHGGSVHVRFLSKELAKRHINVEHFSYTRTENSESNIHTALSLPVPFLFYKICLNKHSFFRLVKNKKPDVIHMHHCAGNLELSIRKLRSSGLPVVGTVHISPSGDSPFDRAIMMYFSKVLRKHIKESNALICVSRYVESRLNSMGIHNTTVIPNAIDRNVFHRTERPRKRLGIKKDAKVILFVGRLSPEKGIIELMKAFKKPSMRNNTLYIIGSGPLKWLCKLYSLKHKNIVFVGRVEENLLREYYSAADLTVAPSKWNEAFGMVIIESMACGTPVLSSAKGAIPEIVSDGRTGFLLKRITPDSIANAIETSFSHDLKRMGNSGMKYVNSRFLWEHVAEKTIEVYRRAIE